jgi:lycopene cyclase domain-containing protein
MKFAYLLVNLGSVLIPFIFSFHPKLQFYKHFGAFAKGLFPVAVLFLVWDAIFTDIGVWGFNPDYLTEISLYNLPLEEVLFFICIPFACVFTYHCLKLFFSYQLPQQIQAWIIGVLVTILILVGLLHLFAMDCKTSVFI